MGIAIVGREPLQERDQFLLWQRGSKLDLAGLQHLARLDFGHRVEAEPFMRRCVPEHGAHALQDAPGRPAGATLFYRLDCCCHVSRLDVGNRTCPQSGKYAPFQRGQNLRLRGGSPSRLGVLQPVACDALESVQRLRLLLEFAFSLRHGRFDAIAQRPPGFLSPLAGLGQGDLGINPNAKRFSFPTKRYLRRQ